MIARFLAKALPFLATASLLIPAGRKLLNPAWREQLGASYQLGNRDCPTTSALRVGPTGRVMISDRHDHIR